jgi:hypothetical protein
MNIFENLFELFPCLYIHFPTTNNISTVACRQKIMEGLGVSQLRTVNSTANTSPAIADDGVTNMAGRNLITVYGIKGKDEM